MAAGLLMGGAGFVGIMVGARAARNFFSDERDSKTPDAHNQRMNGVANRLMAHPQLLGQYNEKYLDKKFEQNSVMRRASTKREIQRSRSQEIQRTASSRAEKAQAAGIFVDSPAVGA